jgi:hypothetical protein
MRILRNGRFALLASSLPAPAASAGVGLVQGAGTISPGQGAGPTSQSITFSGSLTGTGVVGTTPVVIADSCTFNGASTPTGDNVAVGVGNVSGSCTGSLAIAAQLTYVRIGAIVAIAGNAQVNGSGGTANAAAGACLFLTTQTPPITNYQVVCATAAVAV